jgi:hypothetical protein
VLQVVEDAQAGAVDEFDMCEVEADRPVDVDAGTLEMVAQLIARGQDQVAGDAQAGVWRLEVDAEKHGHGGWSAVLEGDPPCLRTPGAPD